MLGFFSLIIAVWSTKGHLVITFSMRGLWCHVCYRSLLRSLQPRLYWSDLGFGSWLPSGQSQWVARVPLDTTEVFWSSCQYTPTLAICRWAFSPLTPCFFLSSLQPGCCSVCQRCQLNNNVEKSFGNLLHFLLCSLLRTIFALRVDMERKYWIKNTLEMQWLSSESKEGEGCWGFLSADSQLISFCSFTTGSLFILIKIKISVQEGLAMNFIEPSFLSAGQNLKKVACLHLMGHHQYPIWQD